MKLKTTFLAIIAFLCYTTASAQCNGAQFEEVNGIALLEMESGNLPSNWESETGIPNFTGNSYITWEGTNSFNTPGNGIIEYKVRINSPGAYRFQWRNTIGIGNNTTEYNDSWLRFPDADDFYAQRGNSRIFPRGSGKSPNPNGASSSGWFKIYANNLNWNWGTNTSDNDPHLIFVQFNSPGVYTIQVSGRSKGHAIDRMVLYKEGSFSESSATSTSRGETTCDVTPPPADVEPEIKILELINANTNQPILNLTNNITINISDVTANLTVNAVPEDDSVGSVRFDLDGPITVDRVDNSAPFSLFGESGSNFEGENFTIGDYTLRVTPYSESNTSGETGDTITINFTIEEDQEDQEEEEEEEEEEETSNNLTITSVTYVNASTSQTLGNLTNGTEINLSEINNAEIAIIASAPSSDVQSVRFSLNGPISATQTENIRPYSLFGDLNNILNGQEFPAGSYQLSATPYAQRNASGEAGNTTTISFNVVENDNGGNDDEDDSSEEEEEDTSNDDDSEEEEEEEEEEDTSNDDDDDTDLAIVFLEYVNANTGQTLGNLTNGTEINLSEINNADISIIASAPSSDVQSVRFSLSGPLSVTQTENIRPYSLFGDLNNILNGQEFPAGSYQLSATPYAQRNASGEAGNTTTISFNVVENDNGGNDDEDDSEEEEEEEEEDTSNDDDSEEEEEEDTSNDDDSEEEEEEEEEEEDTSNDDDSEEEEEEDTSNDDDSEEEEEEEEEDTSNDDDDDTDLAIVFLEYVNASTGQTLGNLTNGTEINLSEINNADISIIASAPSSDVQSVRFSLSGPLSVTQTENIRPYSLFGDLNNILNGQEFPTGSYQLSATPYSEKDAGGEAGATNTVTFTVIDVDTTPTPSSDSIAFILVNSTSDNDILTLVNGSQISQTVAQNINIRIATSQSGIGSVGFELSGARNLNVIENIAAYALFGNIENDFRDGQLGIGNYSLKVTVYTGRNLAGSVLDTRTVSFSVIAPSGITSAKLYPNPVIESTFNLEVLNMSTTKELNYSIINTAGLEITSGKLNNKSDTDTFTVPVSSTLGTGLYYIIIYDGAEKKTISFFKE